MVDIEFITDVMGSEVLYFTITDRQGRSISVLNYGATLTAVRVPDREGVLREVAVGLTSPADYLSGHPCLGSTVGRYANRIAKGRFSLNGKEYVLNCNEPPNHLHGGPDGFDKRVWQAEARGDDTVAMRLHSPDGDQGYPGDLDATVTFSFSDGRLTLAYYAMCSADTVINLTNHAYFNLSGCQRDVLDHELAIRAKCFTPMDHTLIPTGELRPVAGTPFDFTSPRRIGDRICGNDEQLKFGSGYDHNYALDAPGLAANVYAPDTGITMDVLTDMPGVQLYTANHLNMGGRDRVHFGKHYGVCLETQFFPDSPNQPGFPSCVLRHGQVYEHQTTYAFSVR